MDLDILYSQQVGFHWYGSPVKSPTLKVIRVPDKGLMEVLRQKETVLTEETIYMLKYVTPSFIDAFSQGLSSSINKSI